MNNVPEYRKRVGSYHCSASGATQSLDDQEQGKSVKQSVT